MPACSSLGITITTHCRKRPEGGIRIEVKATFKKAEAFQKYRMDVVDGSTTRNDTETAGDEGGVEFKVGWDITNAQASCPTPEDKYVVKIFHLKNVKGHLVEELVCEDSVTITNKCQ